MHYQRHTSSRSFLSLLATQFLGAMNDNTFKIVVSLLIAEASQMGEGGVGQLCLTQVFFALPYILFSSYSGWLADRFSKPVCIRLIKCLEVFVMTIGAYFLSIGNPTALLVVLFMMGAQSALFSPFKYGIMPEILDQKELSRGNGYLEFWNFIAIITGSILGTFLKVSSGASFLLPALVVIAISCVGLVASFGIKIRFEPKKSKQAFSINPFKETIQGLKTVSKNRTMVFVFFSMAFFWFFGSFMQLGAFIYVGQFGENDYDLYSGLFFAALGVGIGAGSILAGLSSGDKVELGLVPIGALAISICTFLLALSSNSLILGFFIAYLIGVSAGIFIVPVDAYVQEESPESERGRIIASSNVLSFIAVILGAGVMWLLVDVIKLSVFWLFSTLSLLSLSFFLLLWIKQPFFVVRSLNWLITQLFYRVNVVGVENIPQKGGALIVCNHVTYMDASLILSSIERPIRFLMHKPIYESFFIKPIASRVNVIPIDAEGNPKDTMRALKDAREAIKAGELVCIFAEGMLSRVGVMGGFQKGFERIMKGLDEPIIPACLDQLWGSIFSFKGGKALKKIPRQIPYKLSLGFGAPLPAASTVDEVRTKVLELSSELYDEREMLAESIEAGFLNAAKKNPFKVCLEDSTGKRLRYFQALSASLFLAEKLKAVANSKYIGVVFPPTVAGVLSNLATLNAGKIPVNLNITASSSSITSAISQCEITHVLTSKAFVEKLPTQIQEKALFIEDLVEQTNFLTKILYLASSLLMPKPILKNIFLPKRESMDETATIIFSSGSTGEPKGVMLSHRNICSNLQGLFEVFPVNKKDTLLGVLPFFHVFGFTGTMLFPLFAGMRAYYHLSPLDAQKIGELVESEKVSILMTTPTFLISYMRRCKPEQFKSIRFLITGAEKLDKKLRERFEKRFGIFPLEGYGASELSPVAVINLPDFRTSSMSQIGQKAGTVGRPLPGVSVKIVDPDNTSKVLAAGASGLLLVKGPNVMRGYLHQPEKTAEVVNDGWYNTGDIAMLDKDGFVTITDRMSRFSKIGGEMVPHIKIEQLLREIVSNEDFSVAVTGVKDEKKGEKLVVLYAGGDSLDIDSLRAKMSEAEMPNLWIPKKENFFQIDEIPKLATGKLDLGSIKKEANRLTKA